MTEQNQTIVIHQYPIVSIEDQPWDAETCAKYLGVSRSTFDKTIRPTPKFPKAFKLAGGHPRWMAGEVIEWVKKQKEEQNRKRSA